MDAYLRDWLHLGLRWFHIIAGIAWIGSSLFFMWLDSAFARPAEERDGVAGELWMVHGGHFYRVEKQKPAPGRLPPVLHWFKWEATLTWISGFLLLTVTYYLGGLMTDASDPHVAHLSKGAAVHLGVASLAGGWLVYDLLWRSPLGRRPLIASALSLAALAGAAWLLSRYLSGRAAFLHIGALLGTCMVLNVWVHILPAQRRMIADLAAGKPADFTRGEHAKRRSTHNTYMTFPVIYTMLSNHFFLHFTHAHRWAVLGLLMVAGALVRRVMIVGARRGLPLAAATFAALAFLYVWAKPEEAGPRKPRPAQVVDAAAGEPLPTELGAVAGVVRFDGAPPPPRSLDMTADCAAARGAALQDESVQVADGKVADALVWISDGWQRWEVPPPEGGVVVDQRGCAYTPHVVAARVGQQVTILNSDPILHNVHAYAQDETAFNRAMPSAGTRITHTFDEPEVFARLKCDVHPWMSARIAVLPHPWFAITTADGSFTIGGIPPGDYTLEAVHETLGRVTRKITVGGAGKLEVELTLP